MASELNVGGITTSGQATVGNQLFVTGGTGTTHSLRFDDTGGTDRNALYVDTSSGNLTLGNANYNATELVGNVGVGTSSPDKLLHLEGANATGNTNPITLRFTDIDTASAVNQIVGRIEFEGRDAASVGVGSYIQGVAEDTSGNQYMSFGTGAGGSASERLRIDSAGLATFSNGVDISSGFLTIGDYSELTIATGAITVTGSHHHVDTESDAASDDLDTINGGSTGTILRLCPTSSARTVVLKDGTGNLALAGDFSMDSGTDLITLLKIGGTWTEQSRSNNA